MDKVRYIPGEIANTAIDEHGNRKPVTRTHHIFDDAKGKRQSEVNKELEEAVGIVDEKITAEKIRAEGVESGLNNRLGTVEQLAEISIGGGDAQIATSSDFTNPDATKRAKVPTVGAIVDGLNDGVYDVSKRNPTGGPNSDGKFTLDYILANANTLIPTSWRHGGMIISFAQSSDNKYVQYRLTADEWSVNTEDWAIAEEGIYAENPEFVEIHKDKNGLIYWAVKANGSVFFGAGVPPQVKSLIEYWKIVLQSQINDKASISSVTSKVDKVTGKTLIDEVYSNSVSHSGSAEWVEIITDKNGLIIEGRKVDGQKFIFGDTTLIGKLRIKGIELKCVNNEEFIDILTDKLGHIILGVKKDGRVYISQLQSVKTRYVDTKELIINGVFLKDYIKSLDTHPTIWAPKNLYVLENVKSQVFTCGLVRATSPTNCHLNIAKISGTAKGVNLDRLYEYTPVNGDSQFVLNFGYESDYIENRIASPNNTTIIPVSAKSSPSSNKNILLIGDSFTYGGYYPAELKRLLTGIETADYSDPAQTNGNDALTNLTFIGTRRTDIVPCEGYGGWAYSDFCAASRDNTPNPFWDSNEGDVNFDTYCTNNGYARIDIAIILLGRNMGYSYNTGKYAKKIWDKLLEHNSNIKVLVLASCFPSPFGTGVTNGLTQNMTWLGGSEYTQRLAAYYEQLASTPEYSSNFLFVESNSLIDNQNNMQWDEVGANNRREDIKTRQAIDSVHPSKYGYWQYADAIRPVFHYWCL